MKQSVHRYISRIFLLLLAALVWSGIPGGQGSAALAQNVSSGRGSAMGVDLVRTAQSVSMRDIYARALYLHIRANPAKLNDPGFYVNFVIFLLNQSPKFDCDNAFASEFEKQDFFRQSGTLKDQIYQAVNAVTIPQRFDVMYSIDTGQYNFDNGSLPFSEVSSVGLANQLSNNIAEDHRVTNCANRIQRGVNLDFSRFPWSFSVATDTQNTAPTRIRGNGNFFPFGGSLTVSNSDARILFDRFGRRLYAIVSYSVRAAGDGSSRLQIIPTDGQMFGLSADAVVRVKTHAHPSLSQPGYFDFSNPLQISGSELGMTVNIRFQQDGFRAVGRGETRTRGTAISSGQILPVSGSAAVGHSAFVVRLATGTEYAPQYLTLFGNIDHEKIGPGSVPVSGMYEVVDPTANTGQNQYRRNHGFKHFTGFFSPPGAVPAEPEAPASILDQSAIVPADEPAVTPQATE